MFKSSFLELKDRKVSNPKVMLKPEFAIKKSLRLKFVKVGIEHPSAQTPMSDPIWICFYSGFKILYKNVLVLQTKLTFQIKYVPAL